MEPTRLTQLVADRRAARETDARDRRLGQDVEAAASPERRPRLRHQRRHRPLPRRESLAGG
jgi:hypothetical protein